MCHPPFPASSNRGPSDSLSGQEGEILRYRRKAPGNAKRRFRLLPVSKGSLQALSFLSWPQCSMSRDLMAAGPPLLLGQHCPLRQRNDLSLVWRELWTWDLDRGATIGVLNSKSLKHSNPLQWSLCLLAAASPMGDPQPPYCLLSGNCPADLQIKSETLRQKVVVLYE